MEGKCESLLMPVEDIPTHRSAWRAAQHEQRLRLAAADMRFAGGVD